MPSDDPSNSTDAPSLLDLLTDPALAGSAQSLAYLNDIPAFSLQDLVREPSVLASEAALLTTELTSLCHREYPTFLHVHSTAQTLAASVDSLSSSLSSLLSILPDLDASCRTFTLTARPILAERNKAALVLENHDKLMDILEIPQLIDSCVRNGAYQDASDLASHTMNLVKRFPDVSIIRSVEEEVKHAIRMMMAQLLTVLREPVKLQALHTAVKFLRKMGPWTEEELAAIFLASRNAHLDSAFATIERDLADPPRYIRKYIDAFRENVHDVVNQYSTIFLESSGPNQDPHKLRQLLLLFAHDKIDALLHRLDTHLPQVEDATSLTSLLTQLTYCSQSFSRIGLDFRSLLTTPFSNAVLTSSRSAFDTAATRLRTSISDAERTNKVPSSWLLSGSSVLVPPFPDHVDHNGPIHVPPPILASFPPLAIYLNALLTALNTIRLLPPLHLLGDLSAALSTSLVVALEALLCYSTNVTSSPASPILRRSFDGDDTKEKRDKEKKVVLVAGGAMVKVLVPFVQRALVEGIYGVPVKEMPQMEDENLGRLLKDWETWLKENGEPQVNGVGGVNGTAMP
jgi:conserved oligomeric Golgi complex subunit 8